MKKFLFPLLFMITISLFSNFFAMDAGYPEVKESLSEASKQQDPNEDAESYFSDQEYEDSSEAIRNRHKLAALLAAVNFSAGCLANFFSSSKETRIRINILFGTFATFLNLLVREALKNKFIKDEIFDEAKIEYKLWENLLHGSVTYCTGASIGYNSRLLGNWTVENVLSPSLKFLWSKPLQCFEKILSLLRQFDASPTNKKIGNAFYWGAKKTRLISLSKKIGVLTGVAPHKVAEVIASFVYGILVNSRNYKNKRESNRANLFGRIFAFSHNFYISKHHHIQYDEKTTLKEGRVGFYARTIIPYEIGKHIIKKLKHEKTTTRPKNYYKE